MAGLSGFGGYIGRMGSRIRNLALSACAICACYSAEAETEKSPVIPLEKTGTLEALAEKASAARLILLGESTHGTSEFYKLRDQLSRILIEQQGDISFVAVEGDWAAMQRLNRYVHGEDSEASSAAEILRTFDRWPQWMWANEEFAQFVEWLKDWNGKQKPERRTSLYGLDLYGWSDSLKELESYLDQEDPEMAQKVGLLYDPLRPFLKSLHDYSLASYRLEVSSAPHVLRAVEKLRNHTSEAPEGKRRDAWNAKEHAYVIAGAERHFRVMPYGGSESWNARVDHMNAALNRRFAFYGDKSRGIIWAHNTHVGDARATSMANSGQRNLGQLSRMGLGKDSVFIVGFSTLQGRVMAGRQWGSEPEVMELPPADPNSIDALMAARHEGPFLVYTGDAVEAWPELQHPLGLRAVGVVYQPEEEAGNYVPTIASERFDVLICIPKTSAVSPL